MNSAGVVRSRPSALAMYTKTLSVEPMAVPAYLCLMVASSSVIGRKAAVRSWRCCSKYEASAASIDL